MRLLVALPLLCGCSAMIPSLDQQSDPLASACVRVEDGYGPDGAVPLEVEVVASGLEVPWALAFLPDGAMLFTERPGRVRLLRDGVLVPEPVVTIEVTDRAEDGLLGIALDPRFVENRLFYLYATAGTDEPTNKVQAYRLARDGRSAEPGPVILEGIPSARYHNGGRIRFGPDAMLYVATGDAREPSEAQDPKAKAGKILRIAADGTVPDDNPWPGSPAWILGVRNSQGFDWLPDGRMVVSDHGPSGEMFRKGNDEVSIAAKGANLGWPEAFGCEARGELVAPAISWKDAVPPGGAVLYRGALLPAFDGDLLVATLRSEHLQRIRLGEGGKVEGNEVYLRGTWGRLREAIVGPDGALYLTTSNCDGRGDCPGDGDRILRVTQR